jgi:uncharacterized membrane protein YkoI
MEIIMRKFIKITIISVTLATVGAIALAAKTMANDELMAPIAKISLIQAIVTAEQQASGKATRAEYEQNKTGWAYDVEVISAGKVFDIRVDADKGTVISSVEDKADRDDHRDKQD